MTIAAQQPGNSQPGNSTEPEQSPEPKNEFPDEVEMTLFEHLEELRSRLFASVIAVVVCIVACFAVEKKIVEI